MVFGSLSKFGKAVPVGRAERRGKHGNAPGWYPYTARWQLVDLGRHGPNGQDPGRFSLISRPVAIPAFAPDGMANTRGQDWMDAAIVRAPAAWKPRAKTCVIAISRKHVLPDEIPFAFLDRGRLRNDCKRRRRQRPDVGHKRVADLLVGLRNSAAQESNDKACCVPLDPVYHASTHSLQDPQLGFDGKFLLQAEGLGGQSPAAAEWDLKANAEKAYARMVELWPELFEEETAQQQASQESVLGSSRFVSRCTIRSGFTGLYLLTETAAEQQRSSAAMEYGRVEFVRQRRAEHLKRGWNGCSVKPAKVRLRGGANQQAGQGRTHKGRYITNLGRLFGVPAAVINANCGGTEETGQDPLSVTGT
ncbi:hypothetical protein BT67DRAFT_4688 [Trichocladium antarcticum]|uniref:Uncharacterized protein n=1 Tax=Trichocladium antarcticum TaxID=1450529 RepID=A0AAN6USZ3_9PEZI|nr:hypothetical protein BT67DRAFT_4688 [Trichocladium antarcticum]